MTTSQISIVRSSFAEVQRRRPDAGKVFYDRLFSIAPEVRPMFKGDPADQKHKLMKTLAVAVATLEDMPALLPIISGLGRRHRALGVEDRHYEPVGFALVAMLETTLASAFDDEARGAWTTLHVAVSGIRTSKD